MNAHFWMGFVTFVGYIVGIIACGWIRRRWLSGVLMLALWLAYGMAIVRAEDAPPADPALAYQTARANALEAENAMLKLQIKNLNMQIVQYQASFSSLTADWPNKQQLEAALQSAQKALDAARDALKKSCPDKWDEVKAVCSK